MTELLNGFKQQDILNESTADMSTPKCTEIDLSSDAGQKLKKRNHIVDESVARLVRAKKELLQVTADFQKCSIDLKKQRLKLADLKNKKLEKEIETSAEDIVKYVSELDNDVIFYDDIDDIEMEQNFDMLDVSNKSIDRELAKDIENIVEEIRETFLKYQRAYQKCKYYLENFIHQVCLNQGISNVERNFREQQCSLFSKINENLISFSFISSLFRKAFHEFESIASSKEEMTSEQFNVNTNLLMAAIEKGEFTYNEIKSLVFEMLNY